MVSTLGATIDDLFIGKDRSQSRTPIDQRLVLISQPKTIAVACYCLGPFRGNRLRYGQLADRTPSLLLDVIPGIKEDQKNPLSPSKVLDVGRR